MSNAYSFDGFRPFPNASASNHRIALALDGNLCLKRKSSIFLSNGSGTTKCRNVRSSVIPIPTV